MSKRVRKYLLIMLAALLLSGCGKEQAAPSEPPGKLIGLTYSKSGGMERGNDFYIRINSGRIETMAYFDPNKLEDIQVQTVSAERPNTCSIWAQALAAALRLKRL